ncbi:MAG: RlmE family RNA methyltransferase [bacterium]|nr:RlmE family RNA methyltransferase [bacterium]
MSYERKDAHYRKAKATGLRARSAFKLEELDARYRLLRPGDHVVDLGAWPGGWLQVAAARVGPRGRVVGVDLQAIAPLGPNVVTLSGDIGDPATVALVRERLGRPADVVLSDLAPKLSGIRDADEARATALVGTVLDVLPMLLRPDGRLLVKLFTNPSQRELVARIGTQFHDVRTTRPEASRRGSSELYAVATSYRGPGDNLGTY